MLIVQFLFLKNAKYMNYVVPIITSVATISSAINYIINPGIIYSHEKSQNKFYCPECKMIYPQLRGKNAHCNICDICISNYDHHCGVIGKCVGRYNTFIFMVLALFGMGFSICIFLIIINLIIRE
jgi:hypothetical protein